MYNPNIDNNIMEDLSRVCSMLGCGNVEAINEMPARVSHKLFDVVTSKSHLIIKQLSPEMLKREFEIEYHINSQIIARTAFNHGINALLAETGRNGDALIKIRCNYYFVYPWVSAKNKKSDLISENDCFIIGDLLARIHKIKIIIKDATNIRREKYAKIDKSMIRKYFSYINYNPRYVISFIYLAYIQRKALMAFHFLRGDSIISHCDLTPDNVLWEDTNTPIVIDWDASGYINCEKDIIQTIEAWCFNSGKFNKSLLTMFLKGYYYRHPEFSFKHAYRAYLSALCEDLEWIGHLLKIESIDSDRINLEIQSIIKKWRLRHRFLLNITLYTKKIKSCPH